MVLAVVFSAYFPVYRLNRELAAAKREGLLLDLSDVQPAISKSWPQGENAATLVRKAIASKKSHSISLPGRETDDVLKGSATTQEKDQVRRYLAQNIAFLDLYRQASRMPRLDYERPWQQGFGLLLPEYAVVKNAGKTFVAAAALGIDPKENLLTAARLSVLTRQDPNLIAQLVSIAMGSTAIRQAAKLGLGREIDSALGAPIDVRWAYSVELPSCLDAARRIGTEEWDKSLGIPREGLWDRLRSGGPTRTNAASTIVHDFRAFWKAMPKDGTDYISATQAADQNLGGAYDELARMSPVMANLVSNSSNLSEPIKAMQSFEELRKAARSGAPLPSPKPLP